MSNESRIFNWISDEKPQNCNPLRSTSNVLSIGLKKGDLTRSGRARLVPNISDSLPSIGLCLVLLTRSALHLHERAPCRFISNGQQYIGILFSPGYELSSAQSALLTIKAELKVMPLKYSAAVRVL